MGYFDYLVHKGGGGGGSPTVRTLAFDFRQS